MVMVVREGRRRGSGGDEKGIAERGKKDGDGGEIREKKGDGPVAVMGKVMTEEGGRGRQSGDEKGEEGEVAVMRKDCRKGKKDGDGGEIREKKGDGPVAVMGKVMTEEGGRGRQSGDENMKPMMPKVDIASEFLAKVKELSMSKIADKSIARNLMTELTSMKFDWSVPIHDHCDQMVNIAAKLKGMGMELPESWLVHLVINSLPPAEFGQFRVNYYTLKEKWSFKETKHLLVQEEARLKWGI
nr:reverse transcriptase [Ipomoea batatas]